MRVLIAYYSKYGTTAACARDLAERIRGGAELVDLGRRRAPDVAGFDVVLIGGSIYGGKIQREVLAFCDLSRELLLARQAGIFICCLYQGERAMAQLRASFPAWLSAHAFTSTLLGGELRLKGLSTIDRLLLRGLPRGQGDVSLIRHEEIERLAEAVNALLPGGVIPS